MRDYLRGVWTIAKKDIHSFFVGPFFYVLCGLAFTILSANFLFGTAQFIEAVQSGAAAMGFGGGPEYNIREVLFFNHYVMYFWVLIFIVGAMAIRFLAEEKRNHTFDLLWTAPVTPIQIIWGKFIAAKFLVFIFTALAFIYPLVTWTFSTLEWAAMLASFLGLFLIAVVFVSAGMFVSSLTSSAVITVVGSVILFFGLLMVGLMEQGFDGVWWAQDVFRHISITTHMEVFIKGGIKLSSVVFLITFSFFWLLLAEAALKFSAINMGGAKMRASSKWLLGTAIFCVLVPAVISLILRFWPLWFWVPVGIAAVALVFMAVLERRYLKDFFSSKAAAKDFSVGSSILLTVILVGVINYIAVKNDHFWDLTEGKVNTLSGQTLKILEGLEDPLKILTLYQDDRALAEVERVLMPLVNMYRNATPQVRYERGNALQQPELVDSYKLGSNEGAVVVIEYQGRSERVPFSPRMTPSGPVLDINENALTTALAKALDTTSRKIYRVTGHGELSAEGGNQGIGLLIESLESMRYTVENLDLTSAEKVPTDGAFVAVWGPRSEFRDEEVQLLRDYIREGGRVFLAIDPLENHGLAQLTKSFGIQFSNTVVYNQGASPLPPTIALGVIQQGGHEITAALDPNLPHYFFNASPLVEASEEESIYSFTSLVSTASPVVSVTSLGTGATIAAEGVMTLAAISETRSAHDPSEDQSGVIEDVSGLLVVGDSKFLTNQFLLQGGNDSLAHNMIYYMSRNQQVMGVQPKRAVGTVLEPKITWYQPVFYFFIGILPVFFLGGGVALWLRRKAA